MNTIKFKGFTLVEMMIVVSMVTLSAIFFTQLFIENSESKAIDREVTAMMTIGAAAIGFVQTEGEWPDQASGDPCSSALAETGDTLKARGYLGDVSVADLTTTCDEVNNRYPIFKLTRSGFDTENVAQRVAAMLPSASVEGTDVTMYTPRPRRSNNLFPPEFGLAIADVSGYASAPRHEECDDPQIIVYPELICSNSLTLGGYRVYADAEGDSWSIYIKARADVVEAFTLVETCNVGSIDVPQDEPLSFRYLTFCP